MSHKHAPKSQDYSGETLDGVVRGHFEGTLTRREAILRASALGLSMSGLAALLAAEPASADPLTRRSAAFDKPSTAITPVRGGTYTEAYLLTPTKLNTVHGPFADEYYPAFFDNVILKDPKGNIVPDLAESWTISPDGLTVTLKIRDGLKYWSGATDDAASIASCLESQRDGGPNTAFLTGVSSFTAGPDNTVLIKLKHPWYGVLNTMATVWMVSANPAYAAKYGNSYGTAGTVDGSGPFILESFDPATAVVGKRNPNYSTIMPFVSNKGPAYLDKVQWNVVLDAATRSSEIEAGTVDCVTQPSLENVAGFKANSNLVVVDLPQIANYYLALNQTRTELGFNNPKVRQAISHAIDRRGLVEAVFFGYGVPTYGSLSSRQPLQPSRRGVQPVRPRKGKGSVEGCWPQVHLLRDLDAARRVPGEPPGGDRRQPPRCRHQYERPRSGDGRIFPRPCHIGRVHVRVALRRCYFDHCLRSQPPHGEVHRSVASFPEGCR
jgi:peptide/nickel transport system substrate-binding protein